jgi:hypothetical protein
LPVLIVRMNADLAMGEVLLKKTGSGSLQKAPMDALVLSVRREQKSAFSIACGLPMRHV